MFRTTVRVPSILIAAVFSSISCTASIADDETSKLKAEVATLRAENLKLKAALSKSSSAAITNASSGTAGGYTDLSAVFGSKEINDLAKLNVFGQQTGKFNPSTPISRAQFVTWLVLANNAMRPQSQIRVAETDSKSSFPDLKPSHPLFKYIQGMANAGWSIGYDDKTFKPDKTLSREEMIAIKTPLDEGQALTGSDYYLHAWGDYKKISKQFIPAMEYEKRDLPNWNRVFGETKICDPQKAVTRAEAAVCLWQFGTGSKITKAVTK